MGKYIDIENINAYDYVTTWDCNCSEYGRQRVMAVDDVNYLPTVNIEPTNQWISVKDRLPTICEDVLTYSVVPEEIEGEDYSPVYVGFYENGKFYSTYNYYEQDSYISLHYVTHWMPLPSVPNREYINRDAK